MNIAYSSIYLRGHEEGGGIGSEEKFEKLSQKPYDTKISIKIVISITFLVRKYILMYVYIEKYASGKKYV